MRIIRENIGNKALVTDTVNTLSGSDFPRIPAGYGVIAVLLGLSSAAFTLSNIARFRLRSGEFTAYDINPGVAPLHFLNWIARFGENRAGTMTTASNTIILPCNMIDRYDDASQDRCQLPRGRDLSLDISIIGSPAAPTVKVGLVLSNQTPEFAPQLLGYALGVAANTPNGLANRAPTNGILRGFGMPVQNATLTNAANWTKLVMNHAKQGDLIQAVDTFGFMAAQRMDNIFLDTSSIWHEIGDDNGIPTGPNDLTVTVDSGTTSLSAVEAAIWQLVPMAA
jgi:hypothetical protein